MFKSILRIYNHFSFEDVIVITESLNTENYRGDVIDYVEFIFLSGGILFWLATMKPDHDAERLTGMSKTVKIKKRGGSNNRLLSRNSLFT